MDAQAPAGNEKADDRRQSTADLLTVYAPEPNALERRALAFLQSDLAQGHLPITEETRNRLRRLQRRTVLVGVASGTISGLVLGGLEIWLSLGLIGDADRGMLDDPVPWSLFYVVVGLVTLVEILFLYWITLRAVGTLKRIVGVPGGDDPTADLVRAALARAALESPNPRGTILGVDPHAFTPRWQLFARNLAYKAKVGLTSFILRIALRRLFVRAVLRSYVPLLAAPLYAAWNAWILHRIMEEARIRAFGPFAVRTLLTRIEHLDPASQALARGGIVEIVRRSADGHPNYVLLLHGLAGMRDPGDEDLAHEQPEPLEAFAAAEETARDDIGSALSLAAILSGRPRAGQLAFLRQAYAGMGLRFGTQDLVAMRRRLRAGRAPFESEDGKRATKL